MLNEDRIKLMTEIAIYEKKEAKGALYINRYFRSDYIGGKLLRSAIALTITYAVFAAMCFTYNAESLLKTVEIDTFITLGKKLLVSYAACLFVYLSITYGICSFRYQSAKRSIKAYQTRLKRLEKRYEFQAKASEMTRGDAK